MRVNAAKTQMLCIHASNNSKITTELTTDEEEKIVSSDRLKIVGFIFGTSEKFGHKLPNFPI